MHKKLFLSRLLAVVLVVVMGLMGCSGSPNSIGLTGDYNQDTLLVVQTLSTTIDLPEDAANKREMVDLARKQINDYIARYRRNGKTSGLRSFTTMQTALNSLAGYYTAYGNRPLSEKLKKRLHQEFKQTEIALKRGI